MIPKPNEVDVAICGAGPVGMALACLLAQRGVAPARIALIDARPLALAACDPRSIAISFGSAQVLQTLGAWPIAATAITQIHVSRRAHFGRTLINADAYAVPVLGYVTRYGALVTGLHAIAAAHGIRILRPTKIVSHSEDDHGVRIDFEDGTALNAALLVQAEGGVFSEQDIKARRHDYAQTALVTHVQASAPIAGRAFERFTEEGPLALLPQDEGYALVWCARPATIANLLALPDAGFLQELGRVFGARLGRFTAVGVRNTYALGLNAEPKFSNRTVAIGNAAQTLHPVAGQGLNLGLRDAQVLAGLLVQDMSPATLAQFVNARKADRGMTIRLTDAMARVFASAADGALSQTVLGASLGLVDLLKPAKRALAEQMMFGWRA
jgi:2-octaprenyl-6-methoxyphenol hydroxylase